ncbi:MAG: hypothetical protein HC820_05225, partial [Hydrococcus sp. RM1_1_31]|nr:hypothetical protein [Hydrococcus sp. RM1_1_31]
MKPRYYLFAIAVFCNLLVISGAFSDSSTLAIPSNAVELGSKERSPASAKSTARSRIVAQVDDIAQQITVRIDSTQHGNGSGVIVAKEGNTYYVLTASHVVEKPDRYQIVTPDGQKYSVNSANTTILEGVDLAVVQFQSSKTHTVATLANYDLGIDKSQVVFVSGFPATNAGTPKRLLTAGELFSQVMGTFLVKDFYSLTNGYELVYSNLSYRGMSGGAILDRLG